jgi:hypothetical protein
MARVDWVPVRGAKDYSPGPRVLSKFLMYAVLLTIPKPNCAQGLKKAAHLPLRHLSNEMFQALMGALAAFFISVMLIVPLLPSSRTHLQQGTHNSITYNSIGSLMLHSMLAFITSIIALPLFK